MTEYIVQWNYVSSLGGPWAAGERVTLSPERAGDINRDSPGVLVLYEPEPDLPPRPPDAPPLDRMQRNPRKRGR